MLGSAIHGKCPTGTRLTHRHDCRRREIYSSDALTGEMDFRPIFGLDFFRLYAECVYRSQVLRLNYCAKHNKSHRIGVFLAYCLLCLRVFLGFPGFPDGFAAAASSRAASAARAAAIIFIFSSRYFTGFLG